MNFAVIHIEKGTTGKAGGLGTHIERTKNVPNADPNLTHKNARFDISKNQWTRELHTESLQTRINNRIKQGYTGKTAIRKDAVTHLNIVMTGSHEAMKKVDLNKWANDNYHFACKRYGRENIVEFAIHLDERTPHIHCVVVPLTADGRLSAKEVMGNRVKMTELQEEYGKEMQKHNLQRGIKGSQATHDSVKEYYARINQRINFTPYTYIGGRSAAPSVEVPPVFGREKWAKNQNRAILSHYRKLEDSLLRYINKNTEKRLKDVQNEKIKAQEQTDRLRKENAQLKGIIREQEKRINQVGCEFSQKKISR